MTKENEPSTPDSKPGGRPRKILLWTVGAVALWAVVLGLVAPPILRQVAEQQLSKNLGSACTLERVAINPFLLRLTLEKMRIPLPDGKECFALERFEARLNPRTLIRFAPVLSDIRVINPRLTMALRRDATLSVTDFAPFAGKKVAPEPPPKSADAAQGPGLFGLVVTNLEISGGELRFRDDIHKADHVVSGARLLLPFTSTLSRHRDRPIAPLLEASVNGYPLRVEGELTPFADRLRTGFNIRLDDFDLTHWQPYVVASGIPITLGKGLLRFTGRLEISKDANGLFPALKMSEVTLRDLSLNRKDSRDPFLQLGEARLEGLAIDFRARHVEARRLSIDNPDVRLRRDHNGRIDLLQLLPLDNDRGAVSESGVGKQPAASPWRAQVAEIKVRKGRIAATLEAPRETQTVVLRDMDGTVTGLDTQPGAPVTLALNGRDEGDGRLNLEGKGSLSPVDLDLRFRLEKLNLKPCSPLLGAVSPELRLGAGLLTLDLQSAVKESAAGSVALITGKAALEHLSLLDGRQQFAALRTLRVEEFDIDIGRQRYAANKVMLVNPLLRMIVASDGVGNLERLLAGPKDKDKTPAASSPAVDKTVPQEKAQPRLRLGQLEISDGRLLMRDERYRPAMVNRLHKVKAVVSGLENSPESRARIAFSGQWNGAPVTAKGSFNPFLADSQADLTAGLKTLDMTSLSPLSERFIAYPLTKGIFTLDSRIQVEKGSLNSKHRIRLDGLELGSKVKAPEAPNLPVKLGVSLLQDPSGNINITLPVHGDLNDPSFSVGGLIFKVIANLLMKAVSSPFTLLGSMLGMEGEGLEFVPFRPGEGRLFAKNAQALPAVAEMLASHPKINLVLIPQADEKDRLGLADAFVRRRLQELKHASLPEKERTASKPREMRVGPAVDADEYRRLLFGIYKEQPFDKPKNLAGMVRELPPGEMMEMIRQHHPKEDAALKQLALERAREVRAAFVALRPELEKRITIDSPKISGVEGGRVVFGIK